MSGEPPAPQSATAATTGARRHVAAIGAIAVVGYVLDQLTKALALAHLDPSNPPSFLGGFLTLRLIRNPGAAFSLGSGVTVVFTIIAIAALVGLLFVALPRVRGWVPSLVVAFLLAGVAGNLTDRLVREPGPFVGHVVDFISLPHFAIFNVADMFITSATVLLVAQALFMKESPTGTQAE